MGVQSEQELEDRLHARLVTLGHADAPHVRDEASLLANLREQLGRHNGLSLSEAEFARVLAHLSKGSVWERAQTLRSRMLLQRDDGTSTHIRFLNTDHWCRNEYQVARQIRMEGVYVNRYDVTILVNGLPLCQIELKRRGLELREAFNQVNRYHRHSFGAGHGLFGYIQVFAISNGVNSRYYANNRTQRFELAFPWADEDNQPVNDLDAFTDAVLEPCRLSRLIVRHTVLHESDQALMVLRPYQVHAVEAIARHVRKERGNGYVWHTTGSGKTLTSFAAARVLTAMPSIAKVLFVVDRADLDDQTTREFNAFSGGSVDGTDNTKALVRQLADTETSLVVTTIQKLNNAISHTAHAASLEALRNRRVVLIFDECHRSQFGEVHRRIDAFFERKQMFGFTGTPILAENAVQGLPGRRTTRDLFGERLHRYVITDAIHDRSVLPFSVEYWGRLRRRDGELIDDEQVAGIDRKGFFEDPERVGKVVDWIARHHSAKTRGREFTAILCVGSVEGLLTYWDAFEAKRKVGEHDLRVVTIFTPGVNEQDADEGTDGSVGEPALELGPDTKDTRHSRERLDAIIDGYNERYGTNFSTRNQGGFYAYYKDIGRRIKGRRSDGYPPAERADILLVVNMFLTGFDAKEVATLYVDKSLRYHGLIQAFSRTNRTAGPRKSHGNVVCFRNLKGQVDEAIELFSDGDARETILVQPYEAYVEKFEAEAERLRAVARTPGDVDLLADENARYDFVVAFRSLVRLRNALGTFAEFNWNDLPMSEQMFEDYKSKYLDLHDAVRRPSAEMEHAPIEGVDFELELIRRDEVNVAYILDLLEAAVDDEAEGPSGTSARRRVRDLLGSEVQLRSKRELIERFLADHLPETREEVRPAFAAFWSAERANAVERLCLDEDLDRTALNTIVANHAFTGRAPTRDTVVKAMRTKPKLLERRRKAERVVTRMLDLVETFDDGIGGAEIEMPMSSAA